MTTHMKISQFVTHFHASSLKKLHLQECLAYTGKADDHPRSFRPCVTPGIQDPNIWVTRLRNCCKALKMTEIETRETYDNRVPGLTERNWLQHPWLKCQRTSQGLGGIVAVAFLYLLTVFKLQLPQQQWQ